MQVVEGEVGGGGGWVGKWWMILVFPNSPGAVKQTGWWVGANYRSHPVPLTAHRRQKALLGVCRFIRRTHPPPSVLRAGKMTRSWQGFNSRVKKHVSVTAKRLRSTLSLTGSLLMPAACELWSTWYGAHTDWLRQHWVCMSMSGLKWLRQQINKYLRTFTTQCKQENYLSKPIKEEWLIM